jgi:hypothetical protein
MKIEDLVGTSLDILDCLAGALLMAVIAIVGLVLYIIFGW